MLSKTYSHVMELFDRPGQSRAEQSLATRLGYKIKSNKIGNRCLVSYLGLAHLRRAENTGLASMGLWDNQSYLVRTNTRTHTTINVSINASTVQYSRRTVRRSSRDEELHRPLSRTNDGAKVLLRGRNNKRRLLTEIGSTWSDVTANRWSTLPSS